MNRRTLLALAATAFLATTAISAPAMAQDRTIAGIVFQQDQFFRTIQMGMEAAAEEAGATLLQGNSESKPEKEVQLIDTFVTRGVDAIVISPISATASAPALQRAKDAGVTIVTYNSAVEGDIPVSYLNSSQRDLGATTGAAAAEFINAELGGSAKVATLGFKALLPEVSADRVDGFIEAVEAGGASIDVVSQQDAWLAEKAVSVAGDIITANPDLNVIYAANEGGTVGAVQAVRNAGKEGEIYVFGIDGSEQLADFLMDEDNVLQAVTAQSPFEMGSMAVKAALDSLDGNPVEAEVVVPALGLNRNDPDAVQAFKDSL